MDSDQTLTIGSVYLLVDSKGKLHRGKRSIPRGSVRGARHHRGMVYDNEASAKRGASQLHDAHVVRINIGAAVEGGVVTLTGEPVELATETSGG